MKHNIFLSTGHKAVALLLSLLVVFSLLAPLGGLFESVSAEGTNDTFYDNRDYYINVQALPKTYRDTELLSDPGQIEVRFTDDSGAVQWVSHLEALAVGTYTGADAGYILKIPAAQSAAGTKTASRMILRDLRYAAAGEGQPSRAVGNIRLIFKAENVDVLDLNNNVRFVDPAVTALNASGSPVAVGNVIEADGSTKLLKCTDASSSGVFYYLDIPKDDWQSAGVKAFRFSCEEYFPAGSDVPRAGRLATQSLGIAEYSGIIFYDGAIASNPHIYEITDDVLAGNAENTSGIAQYEVELAQGAKSGEAYQNYFVMKGEEGVTPSKYFFPEILDFSIRRKVWVYNEDWFGQDYIYATADLDDPLRQTVKLPADKDMNNTMGSEGWFVTQEGLGLPAGAKMVFHPIETEPNSGATGPTFVPFQGEQAEDGSKTVIPQITSVDEYTAVWAQNFTPAYDGNRYDESDSVHGTSDTVYYVSRNFADQWLQKSQFRVDYDFLVNDNNNNSGEDLYWVDATYYDFLSNSELPQDPDASTDDYLNTWMTGLPGANGESVNNYNDYYDSFDQFNFAVKSLAQAATDWRYPLYFGNYYLDFKQEFIDKFFIGDRSTNNADRFYSANNSNGLGNDGGEPASVEGDPDYDPDDPKYQYHRSVGGLVYPLQGYWWNGKEDNYLGVNQWIDRQYYATDGSTDGEFYYDDLKVGSAGNTLAPYFNYQWLSGQTENQESVYREYTASMEMYESNFTPEPQVTWGTGSFTVFKLKISDYFDTLVLGKDGRTNLSQQTRDATISLTDAINNCIIAYNYKNGWSGLIYSDGENHNNNENAIALYNAVIQKVGSSSAHTSGYYYVVICVFAQADQRDFNHGGYKSGFANDYPIDFINSNTGETCRMESGFSSSTKPVSVQVEQTANNGRKGWTVASKFPFRVEKDESLTYQEHGQEYPVMHYVFDSSSGDTVNFTYDEESKEPKAVNYYANEQTVHNMGFENFGYFNQEPGYFPFNNGEQDATGADTGKDSKGYNFGFATKIELKFRIPEGGYFTDAEGNRQPCTFTFTGDDDLWVFIDGFLALDVGGAHSQASGYIDFSVMAQNSKPTSFAQSPLGVFNGGGHWGDGDDDTFDNGAQRIYNISVNQSNPATVHTMTIYHMERGMGDSNLHIDFTALPANTDVRVEKEVATENLNPGLVSGVQSLQQTLQEANPEKDYDYRDPFLFNVSSSQNTVVLNSTEYLNEKFTRFDNLNGTSETQANVGGTMYYGPKEYLSTQSNSFWLKARQTADFVNGFNIGSNLTFGEIGKKEEGIITGHNPGMAFQSGLRYETYFRLIREGGKIINPFEETQKILLQAGGKENYENLKAINKQNGNLTDFEQALAQKEEGYQKFIEGESLQNTSVSFSVNYDDPNNPDPAHLVARELQYLNKVQTTDLLVSAEIVDPDHDYAVVDKNSRLFNFSLEIFVSTSYLSALFSDGDQTDTYTLSTWIPLALDATVFTYDEKGNPLSRNETKLSPKGEFSLSKYQKLLIHGLPVNLPYRITETRDSQYEPLGFFINNDYDTVTGAADVKTEAVNKYLIKKLYTPENGLYATNQTPDETMTKAGYSAMTEKVGTTSKFLPGQTDAYYLCPTHVVGINDNLDPQIPVLNPCYPTAENALTEQVATPEEAMQAFNGDETSARELPNTVKRANSIQFVHVYSPIPGVLQAQKTIDNEPLNDAKFDGKFTFRAQLLDAFINVDASERTGNDVNDVSALENYDQLQFADAGTDERGMVNFTGADFGTGTQGTDAYYLYGISEDTSPEENDPDYLYDPTLYYAIVHYSCQTDPETGQVTDESTTVSYYKVLDENHDTIEEYNPADEFILGEQKFPCCGELLVSGEEHTIPVFNNQTKPKETELAFQKLSPSKKSLPGSSFALYTDATCAEPALKEQISASDGAVTFEQVEYKRKTQVSPGDMLAVDLNITEPGSGAVTELSGTFIYNADVLQFEYALPGGNTGALAGAAVTAAENNAANPGTLECDIQIPNGIDQNTSVPEGGLTLARLLFTVKGDVPADSPVSDFTFTDNIQPTSASLSSDYSAYGCSVYYFKETEPPAGYDPVPGVFRAVVFSDGSYDIRYRADADAPWAESVSGVFEPGTGEFGEWQYAVIDPASLRPPFVGGTGTHLLRLSGWLALAVCAAGCAVMAIAAAVRAKKRKG